MHVLVYYLFAIRECTCCKKMHRWLCSPLIQPPTAPSPQPLWSHGRGKGAGDGQCRHEQSQQGECAALLTAAVSPHVCQYNLVLAHGLNRPHSTKHMPGHMHCSRAAAVLGDTLRCTQGLWQAAPSHAMLGTPGRRHRAWRKESQRLGPGGCTGKGSKGEHAARSAGAALSHLHACALDLHGRSRRGWQLARPAWAPRSILVCTTEPARLVVLRGLMGMRHGRARDGSAILGLGAGGPDVWQHGAARAGEPTRCR